MPTRFPTAVLATLTRAAEPGELRLVITTNAGRELDELVVYAESLADGMPQIEAYLAGVQLRSGRFEGDARHGWRATVQATAIDPDAATD